MPTTKRVDNPFARAAKKNAAKKPSEPAQQEEVEEAEEEVATEAATEPVAASNLPARRQPDFEVKLSELELPTLKVVSKTGALSDKFPSGSIVVDENLVVSDGKTPVEFTVLGARKKYIEDKPYKPNPQPEDIPKVVYSEEEVFALGGTLEWENDPDTGQGIRPSWNEALDLTILLKNPDAEDAASAFFPFEFEDTGDTYALLEYKLMNTAWRKCAGKFKTAYSMHLRQDWLRGGFEMTTYLGTVGGNAVIIPEVRYGQLNGDEFQNWVRSLLPYFYKCTI
jgi:hypothetical protein